MPEDCPLSVLDFKRHGQVKHTLHYELDNDEVLRNLAIASMLFKPRDGVSCPEFIR